MSIWLVLALVIIFFVFAMSCVIIVAWIATGANDVSASNTLDLVPLGQDTLEPITVNNLTASKVTDLANKGMHVLAAETGGFTITTGGRSNANEINNEEPGEGNKLVQTLYIGGKPAVTRTTTFAEATVERTEGPMQLNKPDATKEIVEWFDQMKKADHKSVVDGPRFDVRNMDLNAMMEATQQKKNMRDVLSDEDADDEESDDEDRKLGYENLRREYLLPALAAESKRRDDAAARLRDPHRFHVIIRGQQLCARSSTLQIPVKLFVPAEYSTSPAALNARFAQWSILHISDDGNVPNGTLQQKLLWQSELIPLAELSARKEQLEVDTSLDCGTVAHYLMRLKLVEATPRTHNHPILCSTFFNPASMINHGPATFGTDMRTAWFLFRQIQHQPK
jgi:hypothetical protein